MTIFNILFRNKYAIHFNNGPHVEYLSGKGQTHIRFSDGQSIVHNAAIDPTEWTKAYRQYFTNWMIRCYSDHGLLLHKHVFCLKGKRIRINIDSKSLGDTLAWYPQIARFADINRSAQIFVSHFWPELFDHSHYSQLNYIDPKDSLDNCYATFNIGYYFDKIDTHHPTDPRLLTLGKVATDILGIPYQEQRPLLKTPTSRSTKSSPYVCIATASTAHCKHWLAKDGWQTVVDHLLSQGYEVLVIQKEPTDLKGIIDRTGNIAIEERIADLQNCEFMIGLGSGLSWLAWALSKPVVLISGFSLPYAEFEADCIRIINKNVCHGCWNNPEFTFDRDDWDWCPVHAGTDKAFECSTQISIQSVIEAIDKQITH